MATARLDMRLDKALKEKAEKASALSGAKTLTEYVVTLIEENSEKVLAEHENIVVDDDIFDRFIAACNKTRKPNKALRDAANFAKTKGIK